MKIQIRILAPIDAAAFEAVRLRGLQECPKAFASSYQEELLTSLRELEARLESKPDAAIFGAFDGETLVALVGIRRESKNLRGELFTIHLQLLARRYCSTHRRVGAYAIGTAIKWCGDRIIQRE